MRLRVCGSCLVWFGLFGWVVCVRVFVLVMFFVGVWFRECSFALVCVRVMGVGVGSGGVFTVSFVFQVCCWVWLFAFEG